MLILKYERLDFWGHRIYTEDKKEHFTKEDLKKVFAYFSKKYDVTVQIDNTVMYWDSVAEFNNRIATIRDYDGTSFRNYSDLKKSFEKMKKECYAIATNK